MGKTRSGASESRNGLLTVEAAANLNVGNREYELIELKSIF